jgi:formate dehydrogenase major subunit
MEGRTQYLRKALDASGKEDWRIVTEVSRHLGYEMNYSEEKDIFSRLAHIAPCYRDLSFGHLGEGFGGRRNAVWPGNANPEEVTDISFSAKDFETQRGRSGTVLAAIEYPLRGWGNLERRSSALRSIAFNQYARIGTELASLLSISEGDRVSLSSHVGEVELEARIDVGVPAETVMLPLFSIPELIEWKMNPVTRTPILDTTEIEVRKAF